MSVRLGQIREAHLPSVDASYSELEEAGLAEALTSLTVYHYDRATYGLWAAPEAGYVSENVAELERIVRNKERTLPRYQATFSECWLLIYAMNRPSGAFDVEAAQNFRISSGFDVVLFFDAVSRRYAALKGGFAGDRGL
jgi:hypothetical protein